MDNLAFYDIEQVSFALTVSVKKDCDKRALKEGDYLTLELPDGISIPEELQTGSCVSGGTTILDYEVQNGNFVLTFAKAVNSEEYNNSIEAGLTMYMTLDLSKCKGKDQICLIPARGDEPAIYLQLPEEPSEISGITKTGELDKETNTITWTIDVGTGIFSKGADVSGIVLTETIGTGQTLISVKAGDKTLTPVENNDGTYKISLAGLNLKAPAQIEVVTAVTEDALEQAVASTNALTLENTVAMSVDTTVNGSLSISGETTAKANVQMSTVPTIEKSGKQTSSDTIDWTITVNTGEYAPSLYQAMIVDTLPSGLSYVAGSLKYSKTVAGNTSSSVSAAGEETGTPDSSNWKENTLYVSGQDLYFCMDESTDASYTITFSTKVADETQGTGVTNKAVIKGSLSYQTATAKGDVATQNSTSVLVGLSTSQVKKSSDFVKNNTVSGQLGWKIEPSTKESSYKSAVLTDVIGENQSYLPSSLKITCNGTEVTTELQEKGIFVSDYKEDTKTLTLTFYPEKATGTSYSNALDDYVITYETTAIPFLQKNESMTYSNQVYLNIMDNNGNVISTDNDIATSSKLSSNWLEKDTFVEYDKDGNPYFGYTIRVNNTNIQSLTNVLIQDDISSAIQYYTDLSGNDTASKDWVIDTTRTSILDKNGKEIDASSYTLTYTNDNKVLECKFPTLSEQVIIKFYVTYNGNKADLTTGIYKNVTFFSDNTVKAKSNEIFSVASDSNGYISKRSKSRGWQAQIYNTVVDKNVTQIVNDDGTKIQWKVVLNPNSGTMGAITITDSIKKSQKYIEDSVKLYEASYVKNWDGSASIQKGNEISTDKYKVDFDVSYEERFMYIYVDAGNKPIILEYETGLVGTNLSSVTNTISVEEGYIVYDKKVIEYKLEANSWGSMKSVGDIIIEKQDATNGAELSLAGAEFVIYKDKEGLYPVDRGLTDENGTVTFLGLDVSTGLQQEYYYKESKTPEGYVVDAELKPITVYKGVKTTYVIGNVRENTTEEGILSYVAMQKQFLYMDTDGQEKQISNALAQFTVTFYPHGKDNLTDALDVYFVEKNGAYYYSSDSNETARKSVITNAEDGSIALYGLPWGYYELKEVKAADGFIQADAKMYFEIFDDENMSVSFSLGTNEGENDGILINKHTAFSVGKYKNDKVISGLHFSIHEENEDGTRGEIVTDALNGDVPYDWITTDTEQNIYNLPVGNYLLHDYSMATDIRFTVHTDGSISTDEGLILDSLIKLYDTSVSVEIVKYTTWDSKQQKDIAEEENYLPFADISFIIKGNLASGQTEETYVTDENGKINLNGKLVDGETYTLTEVTPYGYEALKDTVFTYYANKGLVLQADSYDADNVKAEFDTDESLSSLKIVNHSKQNTSFSFIVYDSKQNVGISGMTFTLTMIPEGDEGIMLLNLITVESGKEGDEVTYELAGEQCTYVLKEGEIFIPDLGKGKYILTLENLPEGYSLTGESLSFSFEVGTSVKNSIVNVDESDIENGSFGMEIISGSNKGNGFFSFEPDPEPTPEPPSEPETPETPESPSEPETPETPESPSEPETPETPESPSEPETPETPESPSNPETPETPDVSVEIIKYTSWDSKTQKDIAEKENYLPFANVSFVLKGKLASGQTEETYVTDENGKINLDGKLVDGETYILTEVTPHGYEALVEDTVFTYYANKGLVLNSYDVDNVTAEFDTDKNLSSLKIVNHSKQNTVFSFVVYDSKLQTGISGITFTLTMIPEGDGGIMLLNLITVESGKAGDVVTYELAGKQYTYVLKEGEIFIPDLGMGTYILAQESVPEGYSSTGELLSFSFKIEGELKNSVINIEETHIQNGSFGIEIISGSNKENGFFSFESEPEEDDEDEDKDGDSETPDGSNESDDTEVPDDTNESDDTNDAEEPKVLGNANADKILSPQTGEGTSITFISVIMMIMLMVLMAAVVLVFRRKRF